MSQLSGHDQAILNCVFNPNLPLETAIETNQQVEDEEDNSSETEESKKVELEAIQLAENGKLDEGLTLINRAIESCPKRASLYNNRAYIYQFQRKFEDAFNDLNEAINLADNKTKKTLSQAHCQRGILHRRADRLELAKADFEISAKLGNQFAKNQLVELNPYAALCNQMLRKVMEKM